MGHKNKRHHNKSVWFFRDFWQWFTMLPLMFELLNHIQKRAAQQGKGKKKMDKEHTGL